MKPSLRIVRCPACGGDHGSEAHRAVVKLSRLPAYDSGRTAVEWW
jgi:hypothetical protein